MESFHYQAITFVEMSTGCLQNQINIAWDLRAFNKSLFERASNEILTRLKCVGNLQRDGVWDGCWLVNINLVEM